MNLKKAHLCLLFMFAAIAAHSQKVYFIYIQTENNQPFFVKHKEKIHSSSATGYVILSKLVDTIYSFSIGMPNNSQQQNFTVAINKKDHGYLLKNFGDKGWGLFDLQTLAVKMSSTAVAKMPENATAEEKTVTAFTESLSKAAGDPSLKNRPAAIPVAKIEEKKEPVVAMAKVTEVPMPKVVEEKKEPAVAAAKPIEAPTPKVIEEPKAVLAATTPVAVAEKAVLVETKTTLAEPIAKVESKTTIEDSVKKKEEPVNVVVEKSDNIKIEPIEEVKPKETPISQVAENPYTTSTVKKRSESSTTEGFGLTFLDIYASGTTDTIRLIIPNPKTIEAIIKTPEAPITTEAKIACMQQATEADFFKLRKLMVAVDGDDEMISEAKKVAKEKCFTTLQYKNLGGLFLTDEGKYKFFDAMYNYTSDTANYASLQTEMKEEYYINRFKALLRN